MKLTVFVLALVSVALAFPQGEAEEELQEPAVHAVKSTGALVPRIINGRVAAPHSIPYQVFLQIFAYATKTQCSGTLISVNYVLTAAHCLKEAVKAEVYLGFYDLGKMATGQKLVTSTSITSHEGYTNTSGVVNDIGVIRLPQPIVPNDFITVVQLPTRADIANTYEGQNGRVSGWGRTSSSSTISSVLIEANATIITNTLCNKYFKNLHDYNICISGDLGVSSCKGDSGGPLVIGNTQVGLVSFGISQCLDGYPSAFTRITAFFDWLEAHTDLKF